MTCVIRVWHIKVFSIDRYLSSSVYNVKINMAINGRKAFPKTQGWAATLEYLSEEQIG